MSDSVHNDGISILHVTKLALLLQRAGAFAHLIHFIATFNTTTNSLQQRAESAVRTQQHIYSHT